MEGDFEPELEGFVNWVLRSVGIQPSLGLNLISG